LVKSWTMIFGQAVVIVGPLTPTPCMPVIQDGQLSGRIQELLTIPKLEAIGRLGKFDKRVMISKRIVILVSGIAVIAGIFMFFNNSIVDVSDKINLTEKEGYGLHVSIGSSSWNTAYSGEMPLREHVKSIGYWVFNEFDLSRIHQNSSDIYRIDLTRSRVVMQSQKRTLFGGRNTFTDSDFELAYLYRELCWLIRGEDGSIVKIDADGQEIERYRNDDEFKKQLVSVIESVMLK
jgi:hypothetical protein